MSTSEHISALVDLLTDHTWVATEPKQIVAGAIPNALEYPVIGVFAESGKAVDETLDGVEWQDSVSITIASTQQVDGTEANQAALLAMKDEIVALLYASPDFGDADAVRGSSVRGWDTAMVVFEDDLGDKLTFDYVTIHVDVRYALDLSGN